MTLVSCPECGAQVSNRAGQCVQCGYPLAVAPTPLLPSGAEPVLPRIRTYISRHFALAWTAATGAVTVIMFAVGRASGADAAAMVGVLAVLASSLPIWWNMRRGTGDATQASGELERRVEARLRAAEEQIRNGLAEMEDGSRQISELEERIDFAERLLAQHRDDQLRNPSAPDRRSKPGS